MKRRQVLVGFGGLAAAISGTIGTGAFSSVAADRNVDVTVVSDEDAALSLTQLGDGGRSYEDDSPERVQFSFPSKDERLNGLGLGANSEYEFTQGADEAENNPQIKGLFQVKNQGSQPIDVYSEDEDDSDISIELFDVNDPSRTSLRDSPARLDVGESIDVGFRIRTFGADAKEYSETLTIVGDATE